ncbi:MAG: hypothetical protein WD768_04505, partial [Phycisphaeraceae bacterium]
TVLLSRKRREMTTPALSDNLYTMAQATDQFLPGSRIAVTQQIPQRARVWTSKVTGHIVKYEQRKTGSWYAHSKDDKLWLDRLTLKKDDGEIVVFNLDEFTHVELLAPPVPPAAQAPSAKPQAAEEPSAEAE